MDISKFAVQDTATLHLKSADGTLLFADGLRQKPVRMTFYGPGSEAAARVEERATARAAKRLKENDGEYVPLTPEQVLQNNAQDLADLTAGIENIEHKAAKDKPFRDVALAIFSDRSLGFITNQAVKFRADWGNFTSGSNAS